MDDEQRTWLLLLRRAPLALAASRDRLRPPRKRDDAGVHALRVVAREDVLRRSQSMMYDDAVQRTMRVLRRILETSPRVWRARGSARACCGCSERKAAQPAQAHATSPPPYVCGTPLQRCARLHPSRAAGAMASRHFLGVQARCCPCSRAHAARPRLSAPPPCARRPRASPGCPPLRPASPRASDCWRSAAGRRMRQAAGARTRSGCCL